MPITQNEILLIAHLTLLAFFLGGQAYYLFIVQPASYNFFSTNEQIRYMQNILKRQNPILLLTLCLVVVSGGFMITPLKSALGSSYFAAFGTKLIKKLGFFFIVFFITAYQTLGVGFKIRYLDPACPASVVGARHAAPEHLLKKLNSVRTQMTITSILNILITAFIIYIART